MKKIHRAWLVLAGMMLIYGGGIGVVTNCMGVLFSAIIQDMGFRAGDLSLYYAIRAIAMSLSMGITTRLFFRKNPKTVMAGLGLIYSLSIAAMSAFSSLWQWYISAVVSGIGISCTMVVIPIVLNNWFHKRNGLVIGMTMSASGVAAALFSPVCSKIILAVGWRGTVLIMAGIGLVMVVLPSLFLLELSPDRVGLKPYGYEENSGPGQPVSEMAEPSINHRKAPPVIFFLCLMTVILAGNLVQFNNQLPTFAQTVGYSITVGAALTSYSMIGNLLGKLCLGVLRDKIGIYRSVYLFLGIQICAMVIFLFFTGTPVLLYAGAFFHGTIYAISVTTPSLLLLDVYGPANYKEKVSRMQAINSFIGAPLSAVFPYIYDLTGSFDPVFLYGLIACAVSLVICMYLKRWSAKGCIDTPVCNSCSR